MIGLERQQRQRGRNAAQHGLLVLKRRTQGHEHPWPSIREGPRGGTGGRGRIIEHGADIADILGQDGHCRIEGLRAGDEHDAHRLQQRHW